jgi:uncharacterized membrane protein YjfL (UPF0719 family)
VENTLEGIALFLLLMALVLFGMAVFWGVTRLQGYDLSQEMTQNDNPAVGMRYAFFVLASIVSFSQVIYQSETFGDNVEVVLKYGLPVIAVMVLAIYINDRLILPSFDNNEEVVRDRNVAVALVEGATYVATALIVSSTLVGLETDWEEALLWLVVGQVLLIGIAALYRLLVPGVFEQLDRHNLACALSLGGLLVSVGIVLSAAVSGESSGFWDDVVDVGLFLAGWSGVIVAAHFLANLVALPSVKLRDEVMEQENVAAGVMEAVFFIGFTLLYTFVVG